MNNQVNIDIRGPLKLKVTSGNYKTRGMETAWTSKENLFTMFALVDVLIKLFYSSLDTQFAICFRP